MAKLIEGYLFETNIIIFTFNQGYHYRIKNPTYSPDYFLNKKNWEGLYMGKQDNEMYCPECGKPIKRKAKFCSECGVHLKNISTPQNHIVIDQCIDKIRQQHGVSGGTVVCGIVFGIEVLLLSGIMQACMFGCFPAIFFGQL